MSGGCNREETQRNPDDLAAHQEAVVASSPGQSKSRSSGAAEEGSGTNELRDGPEKRGVLPKKGFKLSRNELLDSAEFNKTIATWFGEKGFIAMRSFFRASVLNSLQKDPMGLNQASCTDLDAAIVTLIADYLVKNGKYFTMSVFSNEAIRPLVNSNPNLNQVLQRIGSCEKPGPTLTRETVSFVLRTLDVRTHSVSGASVLQKYFEDRSGDLLSLLMGLIRENAPNLNVRERAVRDNDVVAAFSEGLQEEMGKLHCWFSNFNNQFVDVSGKLKKLMCSQPVKDGVSSEAIHGGRDANELWNEMVRMDEHLKKQQACLMKMRDKERKKLATYAKELEDLHQEMNQKLKSIQDYEKTLKMREKALKEVASMDLGRGDHRTVDVTPRECCAGIDARDEKSRCFGALMVESKRDAEMTAQIMQENLELKAILREQNLRIDALTAKAALLTAGHSVEPTPRLPVGSGDVATPNILHHTYSNVVTSSAYRRNVLPLKRPQSSAFGQPFSPERSLVSAMSSALRRARMEIGSLRDEQNTTDLQYDRLLHNKLSKRLYSFDA